MINGSSISQKTHSIERKSPTLGDFKALQSDILSCLEQLFHQHHEDVIQLDTPLSGLLSPRIYIIYDMKLAETVLHNHDGNYCKGGATKHIEKKAILP